MNIYLLLLEIFLARIVDVSIGVLRTVELVKDHTIKAVILAFFEVLIWFLIAREALTSKEFNFLIGIFYSLGYATGTLVGSFLSKKLIKGSMGVQIISSKITLANIDDIKKKDYGLSYINLEKKNKRLIIIEVDKKRLSNLLNLIKHYDSNAFITVSDTKYVKNGYL